MSKTTQKTAYALSLIPILLLFATSVAAKEESMDLYHEVRGAGEPVVLIHSGGADLRDWRFIAPILADEYKVILFDGRGAGRSPVPEKQTDYVRDLGLLMDYLGVAKANLVGHSMGGQIATDFALTFPERVERLVLLAPGLTGFEYSPEFLQNMAAVQAEAPDVDKMVDRIFKNPAYGVVSSGPKAELMREMTAHNMAKTLTWKSFEIEWPSPPAAERLGDLDTPTLFVLGSEDSRDLYRIKAAFERVRSITMKIVQGADHMLTFTHPDETGGLIRRFLGR